MRKRPYGRLSRLGNPRDLYGLRTLVALLNLELQGVALLEVIERRIHQLVGVEEEVLLLSFDFDESEALIGETSYDAFLHVVVLQ